MPARKPALALTLHAALVALGSAWRLHPAAVALMALLGSAWPSHPCRCGAAWQDLSQLGGRNAAYDTMAVLERLVRWALRALCALCTCGCVGGCRPEPAWGAAESASHLEPF